MKLKPQTKRDLRDVFKVSYLVVVAGASVTAANVVLALPDGRRNSWLAAALCMLTGVAYYCFVWGVAVAWGAYLRRRAGRKPLADQAKQSTTHARVFVRDGRWLGDPNER